MFVVGKVLKLPNLNSPALSILTLPVRSWAKSFSNMTILKGDLLPDDELSCGEIRSNNVKTYYQTLLSKIYNGGGKKSIEKHTKTNKKILARERLKMIFDANSPLLELGTLAGMEMDYGSIPGAASLGMIGKIHGLYCIVGANDATVKGGAFFPISVVKGLRGQAISFLNYLPAIYVVDSAGAFLPLQADIFPDKNHGGRSFRNEAVLSSFGIPQLSVVAGSCTAGAAYGPAMTEECVIVKGIGLLYLGGPPLVKAATGEIVTDQELGGAEMHCSVSGCTDHFAETEAEAYDICRDIILGLNVEIEHNVKPLSEPLYEIEELGRIAGKIVITKQDIYMVLARVLDGSSFKEFKTKFGENLVTGFGYISGDLVGIIANCGSLSSADGEKGTHFIQLCDRRRIPLIFLQNSGDVEKKTRTWNNGVTLKDQAKVISAHSCASVPKISINIGGCFEEDNFIMCGMSFKPNFSFSWPLAHSSLFPASPRKIMSTSMEPGDYTDDVFQDHSSAFYRASRVEIDSIILPEDTRKVLTTSLDIIKSGQRIKQLAAQRKICMPLLRM